MTINERLQQVIDTLYKGNKLAFAKATGITPTTLEGIVGKRQSKPSFDTLGRICAGAHVSVAWLLAGIGSMFDAIEFTESELPQYASKNLDACQMDRADPKMTRPRIPFTAAAGSLSIATDSAGNEDCERFPVITTFPSYDFTIKIEGDSMAPDYLSGDELACRFVDDPANIKWGEPHILDTRDGVVFKVPYYGGDQIMCRSINPNGPSFLVNRADVLHVASIVGFTRQLQP